MPKSFSLRGERDLSAVATNEDSGIAGCHTALAEPITEDRLVMPSQVAFPSELGPTIRARGHDLQSGTIGQYVGREHDFQAIVSHVDRFTK